MAQLSKTFRIFVSSTFNDFKHERDALQSIVFPRLRKLCATYGCRFQAIDLRWGVSEEAGRDQATMSICFNEIERSQRISPRPNFIVLLGDRYGWRPLPSQIESIEFEELLNKFPESDRELILWDDARPEKGNGWYQKDENAIPPEYRLRERSVDLPDDVSEIQRQSALDADVQEWNKIEKQIRTAFLLAIERLGWSSEDPRRHKYETSATEQEILRGTLNIPQGVPEAREHVFCFFRSIQEISEDKTAKDFFDLLDGTTRDVESRERLEYLKQRLVEIFTDTDDEDIVAAVHSIDIPRNDNKPGNAMRQWLRDLLDNPLVGSDPNTEIRNYLATCSPGEVDLAVALELQRLLPNVFQYETDILGGFPEHGYLQQLCDDVYSSLAGVINSEIAKLAGDELETEIENHRQFVEDRVGVKGSRFIGRQDVLDRFSNYIETPTGLPLAIFGTPGSGKSALMARAAQLAADLPNSEIIVRFIGTTPDSSGVRALLFNLCRQIARRYGDDMVSITPADMNQKNDAPTAEDALPTDFKELVDEFPRQLSRATAERPLILFLDALDQLSDDEGARNLLWLPGGLPDHVHLIVSTANELPDCLEALKQKLHDSNLIELEPMDREDGLELLTLWLKEASRTLQPDQFKGVLDQFMGSSLEESPGGLPLYLKLAFEEARHWRSYYGSSDTALEATIPGIIRDNLLKRLSAEGNHGRLMVSRSLAYLAAAKNGLSEDEMLDILSLDDEVMADFQRRSPKSPDVDRLPIIVWSRLQADLAPYLSERRGDGTSLMTFYHRQLGEVVEQEYLGGEEGQVRHAHLANYFLEQDLELKHAHGSTPNYRKMSELPYQQTHALDEVSLQITLSDFKFLQAKIGTFGPQPLVDDYEEAERNGIHLPSLMAIKGALQLSAHVLADDPSQVGSQLTGRLLHSDLQPVRSLLQEVGKYDRPWLRPLKTSLMQPGGPLLRTLVGHRSPISEVTFTEDEKFIASKSKDGTVRIWDCDSGNLVRELTNKETALQEWKRAVRTNALVEDPTKRRRVRITYDAIEVYEERSSVRPIFLLGHNRKVTTHAFSPDGTKLVTGGDDYTVRVWEMGIDTSERSLDHAGGVTALAAAQNGKWAISGGVDGTLRLWDLKAGSKIAELPRHSGRVNAIAIAPDGRRAVTGSKDSTIRVWDLEKGVEFQTLNGHEGPVVALAMTSDGRRAVTASEDRTLKTWDLMAGTELSSVRGPHSQDPAIAISPDGQLAVAAYRDRVLRIWDLSTSKRVSSCIGHQNEINDVSFSPDGKLIVSGGNDQTIRVWEVATGRSYAVLTGHWDSIRALAFPKIDRVISVSEDDTVRVWDLKSGKEIQQLGGRKVDPSQLSLSPAAMRTGFDSYAPARVVASPDGIRVLSFYVNDDTLRLWDIEKGEQIAAFTGEYVLACCAITEDATIIAGTRNGQIHILRLEGPFDGFGTNFVDKEPRL